MPYTNRLDVVQRVLTQFAGQITAPSNEVDGIGRRLLPHIIAAMPAEDGSNWGVLEKRTSNPHSVPYDILVWKPTREHFDILTSIEVTPGMRRLVARFGAVGVLPKPTWHWCDWRETQTPIVPLGELPPVPVPEPPPTPEPPADIPALWARLRALEDRVDRHLKP